jgi:polysaccharide export outer membrane protein
MTPASVSQAQPAAPVQETVASTGNAAPKATEVASTAPTAAPNAGGFRATNDVDVLKIQDEVLVTFADVPLELKPIQDQVKQDGTITLLFNHTFPVAGKSRRVVEKEVHDFYVPSYYRNMTVTVRVVASTQFYYVNGEVKVPNRQIYIGRPLTVTQAIASAGGFTDFAQKRGVILTRASGQKIKVNCVKALKDPTLDPLVYPGDSIYVPRTWI